MMSQFPVQLDPTRAGFLPPSLPAEIESNALRPDTIQGYVSVTSQGNESLFDMRRDTWPTTAEPYHATTRNHNEARRALESMGFEIIAESRIGAAVAGPPGAYEELTGGRVVARERLLHSSAGHQRYVTHIDIVGEGQPSACGHGNVQNPSTRVEGVLIERPFQYHGIFPTPIPPRIDRFHLRVPDDVALGLGAIAAHRQGWQGDGVVVAMVDSGQYAHPFFAAHHYSVRPTVTIVPGTSPTKDPVGHGTGESANIFAAAPGCVLQPYRASDNRGRLVGAIGGFLRVKAGRPAILSNSWGGDGRFPPVGPPDAFEIAWAIEILDAIEQGIFVIFSAGNGQFSIEPQVPGVLSAGGVFMTSGLDLQASNYTSGYQSPWFQGITVPDVCGLVGMLPRAQYIMLPIPPVSEIDVSESQSTPFDPYNDGTTSSDGWALFSGTSAAAPQIAGVVALMLGAKPELNPLQITQALRSTAIDVTSGHCHPRFNNAAIPGHDPATGNGLVDAAAAVRFVLDNF